MSHWRCAVCGAETPIDQPFSWRCPQATGTDRHHAPQLVQAIAPLRSNGADNPFLAFRPYLAWDEFAASAGLDEAARIALVTDLDAQVAAVAGTGFVTTPFLRADALSDELGFHPDGGVWVKDETGNVAGSQKARHLFTILLHLHAAEHLGLTPWSADSDRPPLAISSCGNAAIAASTLAAALGWRIQVFVPPWIKQDGINDVMAKLRWSDLAPSSPAKAAAAAAGRADAEDEATPWSTVKDSAGNPVRNDDPSTGPIGEIKERTQAAGVQWAGMPATANGRAVDIATIRNAQLVWVGGSRYMLRTGQDSSGQPVYVRVKGAETMNYVLDFERLRPALEPRLPAGTFRSLQ
jgi:hypothetical protein